MTAGCACADPRPACTPILHRNTGAIFGACTQNYNVDVYAAMGLLLDDRARGVLSQDPKVFDRILVLVAGVRASASIALQTGGNSGVTAQHALDALKAVRNGQSAQHALAAMTQAEPSSASDE